MPAALRRKSDGAIYDFDDLVEAKRLVDSGQADLAEPIGVVNPRDGQVYDFDSLDDALAASSHATPAPSHQPQVEKPGYLESLVRGVAQGASMGFADEIVGGLESLVSDKTYEQARDESRTNFDAATIANPGTSFAGEVVGGIGSALIPGLAAAKLAKGVGTAANLAKGATAVVAANPLKAAVAANTVLGAASGAGKSDGGDMLTDAGVGGAVGALIPTALQAGGKVASVSTGWLKKGLKELIDPTVQMANIVGGKAGNEMWRAATGKGREKLGRVYDGLRELMKGEGVDTLEDVARVVEDKALVPAQNLMNEVVQEVAGKPAGLQLQGGLLKALDDVIEQMPKSIRGGPRQDADHAIELVVNAGDDLGALLLAKQHLGSIAFGDAADTASGLVYREAYNFVDDAVDAAMQRVLKDPTKYNEANRLFEIGLNGKALLVKQLDKQANAASAFGTGYRDWGSGAGVGAMAGAAGAGAAAGPIGAAAGLGSSAARSVGGRLTRANMGAAIADDMSKLGKLLPTMPKMPPQASQLAQSAKRFAPAAGVNAFMQEALPPAPKKTPQEKALARIQLERQGMSPTEMVRAQMAIENEE